MIHSGNLLQRTPQVSLSLSLSLSHTHTYHLSLSLSIHSWTQARPTTTDYHLSSSTRATTRLSSKPTSSPPLRTARRAPALASPLSPPPHLEKKPTVGDPLSPTWNRESLVQSYGPARAPRRAENRCWNTAENSGVQFLPPSECPPAPSDVD